MKYAYEIKDLQLLSIQKSGLYQTVMVNYNIISERNDNLNNDIEKYKKYIYEEQHSIAQKSKTHLTIEEYKTWLLNYDPSIMDNLDARLKKSEGIFKKHYDKIKNSNTILKAGNNLLIRLNETFVDMISNANAYERKELLESMKREEWSDVDL